MKARDLGRACVAGGTAMAALLPALLVPRLTWLGYSTPWWQLGVAITAATLAAWAVRWSDRTLSPLERDGASPAARRRVAHDFPFQLARLGFLAALGAGGASTIALAATGTDASTALVAGVVTYLLMLPPVLGTYLLTRRALRPSKIEVMATTHPIGGLRQAVGMRLAFAVQLPVVVCAAGIVLVEQADGGRYARDVETYARERWATLAERTVAALPDEAARGRVFAALTPPGGVRRAADPRAPFAFELGPADEGAGRPWTLRLGPLALLGLVILLATWLGRWLAREVTDELGTVQSGLEALHAPPPPGMPDQRPRAPTLGETVALRETRTLVEAFQVAVEGFERQRAAIREAAAGRRRAEQAKARFLAHMSHELKSPLNSILGFAELLLAEIDGPLTPRQKEQVAIVWRSGESLLRFILALLDLARLEGPGAEALEPEPVTADGLARAVLAQLRADPLGRVKVTVPVPSGADRRCRTDATATARALVLAAGILHDAAERGEVEVAIGPAEAGGLDATVRVVALDADETERVRLIEQVSTARRRWSPEDDEKFGATAATLMLLRRLAEVLDGRFTAVNAGWPRFTLTLPPA